MLSTKIPWKSAALAFASTCLALLALEGALRLHGLLENRGVLDAELETGIEPPADGPAELGHLIRLSESRRVIYELKPGLDVDYGGARVRTEGHGFRSRSSPEDVAQAGYRIVGLGDSFMFGLGVADDEPYLAVLEARIRERRTDLDARILNTAVPGYNTVMEVETLKRRALGLRPHLVIIEFVGNDLNLPNFIRTKNDVLSLDRSFLADFVKHRLRRREELTLYDQLVRSGLDTGLEIAREEVPAEYRDMIGWPAYLEALRELLRLSREHGFEVLSITLSHSDMAHRRAMEASEKLGFHVFEVAPAFRRYLAARGIDEYVGSPLSRGPGDGHPSALGHRIAAGALYRYLEDEILPL